MTKWGNRGDLNKMKKKILSFDMIKVQNLKNIWNNVIEEFLKCEVNAQHETMQRRKKHKQCFFHLLKNRPYYLLFLLFFLPHLENLISYNDFRSKSIISFWIHDFFNFFQTLLELPWVFSAEQRWFGDSIFLSSVLVQRPQKSQYRSLYRQKFIKF